MHTSNRYYQHKYNIHRYENIQRLKIQSIISSSSNNNNNNNDNDNNNIQYPSIPYTEPTRAQKRKKQELKQNNLRQKLLRKTTPHLPAVEFEQKEKQREVMLANKTKAVIAQREKAYKRAGGDIAHLNMNHTISNNNDNIINLHHRNKSSRNRPPSQEALRSIRYQETLNKKYPLRQDICSDSDD